MRLIAFPSWVSIVLLSLVLGLIVLAYLLKPKRRQIAISSLTLWGRVLRQQGALVSRWRWLLSLLLACTIGAGIALALSRPEIPSLGASTQRVLLILDNSPTMATRTRDGESRWQHAVADARRLLARLGAGSEVMLVDTMGSASVHGFVSAGEAWQGLERLQVVTAGAPRLPEIPRNERGLRIHLFSDGVALPMTPERLRLHSVFEPAFNLAITAFETRPHQGDATRIEGLLQVFNPMDVATDATVKVQGPNYAMTKSLKVPAGESLDLLLDLSAGQGGIYRAELVAANDALDADNLAFAVVTPHSVRSVLLVTRGDSILEDSLRALPGIRLKTTRPAVYQSDPRVDAYVFDDFTPTQMPAAGALLFGAGNNGEESDLSITRWNTSHPVAFGVSWQDVRIAHARLLPADGGQWLVRGAAHGHDERALISISDGAPRWIRVAFAMQASNFRLQPGFPVFLGQAVNWLTRSADPLVQGVGKVSVPMEDAAVTDHSGHALPVAATEAGTDFIAPRPGVYTATAKGREVKVVANIMDTDYAQVNRSQWPSRAQSGNLARSQTFFARTELWTALLLLVAVLLLLEWFSWTRKVTV